ncbi:MAG: hypothetical protein DRR16_31305 [Candidatus Parabeggiatoa sp. nov. 3]|nr:MAG: hypothetical protein DRR00_10920 [Gammaproteobacteria bacterium]RKZ57352.1 MAG: hypothetical protein DRQ99_27055 [Gammaproteobacteria bacterium]RKZ75432.1 MAG: hypothetical protein DRR16_31305 [Gammaproteobacteria bacterium]
MSLSYEFYYLLRTEIEQEGIIQLEPLYFSSVELPRLSEEGFMIDEDKRLFRSETFIAPPSKTALPENWLLHLKQGWEQIGQIYQKAFVKQGLDESLAEVFCTRALLGVALLIADVRLDSHTITLSFKGPGGADRVRFKPGRSLLQIDSQENGFEGGAFVRFEPHYRLPSTKQHWQLQLDVAMPYLAPMAISANTPKPHFAPNPVFAVYGLAHGALPENETWPKQLQDFLVGGGEALLVRLLPRLLIRQWQFTRMDLAARLVRQYLQAQSQHFDQAPLSCLPNRTLSNGLQMMARLEADTTLLLSKLHQAIKTLEIQRDNLMLRLREAHQLNTQWDVIWEKTYETPLLDSFEADKQKLQNHIVYLQEGELRYLEGIRRRWHLHFEGRQLARSERLWSLGSILAFLVAVGAASMTASGISQSTEKSESWLSSFVLFFESLQTEPWVADFIRLLNNPVVYWCLVLVLLSPILWQVGKGLVLKIRCRGWKLKRD